jgi:hypothetical protein
MNPMTPMRMTTPIPPQITTPDRVETRLGTLRYFDGVPDAAGVDLLYDHLDFLRGVEVFLAGMRGASLVAFRQGLREVGCADGAISVFDTLMDARSLLLTPNTETVYALAWLDLRAGPLVVESPPNTLGVVDDFWFRYVTDLGNVGPDRGKGGKYLFLPRGYTGETPPATSPSPHPPTATSSSGAPSPFTATPPRRRRTSGPTLASIPSTGRGRRRSSASLRPPGGSSTPSTPTTCASTRSWPSWSTRSRPRRSTPTPWACSPPSGSRRASPSPRTRACGAS